MSCLRCIRNTLGALRQPLTQSAQLPRTLQIRSFGVLSSLPSRSCIAPTKTTAPASSAAALETTFSQPTSLTGLSITQVRGAKRDTYNPSHVVRKRRHGYLSRIRTKSGRKTLLRRKMKRRTTLSH